MENASYQASSSVLGGVVLWGVLLTAGASPALGGSERTVFRFDFGPGAVAPGYLQVLPGTAYRRELGHGFEGGTKVTGVDRGGTDPLRGDFCTGDQPFFFSVDLPEGNYRVTVTLGDRAGESTTTVKAESRRLLLERVRTAPGEFATRTFTVNVRDSRIRSGGTVRLKPRERGVLHWDDRLTLEFGDARPCVCAVAIDRADDAIAVYLAGDSTVTDQPREPWAAWGQMLPRFFKPGVAIANHAESGEALRSFRGEKRLEKVLSTIKPGDYLFIQFGHNDQKERGPNVGAFTTYKDDLKRYIQEARRHGAIPVLVTSMHRRAFADDGTIRNTLGDYPEAVRQAANEDDVPLIDLNAMSKTLFEALGPETSKKAFVHYPAGSLPGQEKEIKDDTHFNAYGAYELARCVVEGIRASKLDLARYLADDVPPFDPAHPDPLASWSLPVSPSTTLTAPEGR